MQTEKTCTNAAVCRLSNNGRRTSNARVQRSAQQPCHSPLSEFSEASPRVYTYPNSYHSNAVRLIEHRKRKLESQFSFPKGTFQGGDQGEKRLPGPRSKSFAKMAMITCNQKNKAPSVRVRFMHTVQRSHPPYQYLHLPWCVITCGDIHTKSACFAF